MRNIRLTGNLLGTPLPSYCFDGNQVYSEEEEEDHIYQHPKAAGGLA